MTDAADPGLVAALQAKKRLRDYFRGLTEHQRRFILDPATRKAALCSRRAGKTHSLLAYFIRVALERPDSKSLYIALTQGSGRKIIWDELKRINRDVGMGIEFRDSPPFEARFQNGSILYLEGAETEADIEKFNGQKFALVGIDESGSFPPHLEKMVREVLTPCLMDLRGTMVLIGTPQDHCRGLFHDITNTTKLPGWSVHRWTWRNNPYVPQDWVDEECAAQGIAQDSPLYERAYNGRWVREDASLMYPFDPAKNGYETLPLFATEWHYCIGVDLGFHDDTAFAVAGWTEDSPTLWGMETVKRPKMSYERIGDDLMAIIGTKKNYQVCMDTGGLGKTIAESLTRRLGIHIKPAIKTEKLAHAAMLRADLRNGKVKVKLGSPLIDEWDQLQLTEDGKEDPTVPNHLSDAFLYAYRQARHYWGKTPEKPKTPAQHWSPSNDEMYQRHVAERQRQSEAKESIFGQAIDLRDLFG